MSLRSESIKCQLVGSLNKVILPLQHPSVVWSDRRIGSKLEYLLSPGHSDCICGLWAPEPPCFNEGTWREATDAQGSPPVSPQVHWICCSPSLVAYNQIWREPSWCQHDADISGHDGPSLAPKLPFQVSGHGWHSRVSLLQRSCPPIVFFSHPLKMLGGWLILLSYPELNCWGEARNSLVMAGHLRYFWTPFPVSYFSIPIIIPYLKIWQVSFLGASLSCLHYSKLYIFFHMNW